MVRIVSAAFVECMLKSVCFFSLFLFFRLLHLNSFEVLLILWLCVCMWVCVCVYLSNVLSACCISYCDIRYGWYWWRCCCCCCFFFRCYCALYSDLTTDIIIVIITRSHTFVYLMEKTSIISWKIHILNGYFYGVSCYSGIIGTMIRWSMCANEFLKKTNALTRFQNIDPNPRCIMTLP